MFILISNIYIRLGKRRERGVNKILKGGWKGGA
jgi:hypothetical protein